MKSMLSLIFLFTFAANSETAPTNRLADGPRCIGGYKTYTEPKSDLAYFKQKVADFKKNAKSDSDGGNGRAKRLIIEAKEYGIEVASMKDLEIKASDLPVTKDDYSVFEVCKTLGG